mmetsp:Transcript_22/g.38  ORF Transcript_22/g.38 Transcript_22/m.38 type:complete len:202 (-) Transcript_22:123-728(-)
MDDDNKEEDGRRCHKYSARAQRDIMELGARLFQVSQCSTQVIAATIETVVLRMKLYAGHYAGMELTISLSLPMNYPFRPPIAKNFTKIWPHHPNVDSATGRISHPMLESDWKPVQSLNTVVLGLTLLFLHFSPIQAGESLPSAGGGRGGQYNKRAFELPHSYNVDATFGDLCLMDALPEFSSSISSTSYYSNSINKRTKLS